MQTQEVFTVDVLIFNSKRYHLGEWMLTQADVGNVENR